MMKGMVFAERYKLEDFIGQGGMSLVYRAVDIRTGHSVAVKILKSEYNSDKEFLERFQRERKGGTYYYFGVSVSPHAQLELDQEE